MPSSMQIIKLPKVLATLLRFCWWSMAKFPRRILGISRLLRCSSCESKQIEFMSIKGTIIVVCEQSHQPVGGCGVGGWSRERKIRIIIHLSECWWMDWINKSKQTKRKEWNRTHRIAVAVGTAGKRTSFPNCYRCADNFVLFSCFLPPPSVIIMRWKSRTAENIHSEDINKPIEYDGRWGCARSLSPRSTAVNILLRLLSPISNHHRHRHLILRYGYILK